jgi:hypothetical protein
MKLMTPKVPTMADLSGGKRDRFSDHTDQFSPSPDPKDYKVSGYDDIDPRLGSYAHESIMVEDTPSKSDGPLILFTPPNSLGSIPASGGLDTASSFDAEEDYDHTSGGYNLLGTGHDEQVTAGTGQDHSEGMIDDDNDSNKTEHNTNPTKDIQHDTKKDNYNTTQKDNRGNGKGEIILMLKHGELQEVTDKWTKRTNPDKKFMPFLYSDVDNALMNMDNAMQVFDPSFNKSTATKEMCRDIFDKTYHARG